MEKFAMYQLKKNVNNNLPKTIIHVNEDLMVNVEKNSEILLDVKHIGEFYEPINSTLNSSQLEILNELKMHHKKEVKTHQLIINYNQKIKSLKKERNKLYDFIQNENKKKRKNLLMKFKETKSENSLRTVSINKPVFTFKGSLLLQFLISEDILELKEKGDILIKVIPDDLLPKNKKEFINAINKDYEDKIFPSYVLHEFSDVIQLIISLNDLTPRSTKEDLKDIFNRLSIPSKNQTKESINAFEGDEFVELFKSFVDVIESTLK